MDNFAHTSFSQCGEDIIIKFIFDNLGIQKPSYIDIGAHHPFNLSNTAIFYYAGARGINIEPNPNLFGEFLVHRNDDINLNIGIANKKGELPFYIINANSISTFDKEEAEDFVKNHGYIIEQVIQIPVETLPNIINEHCNSIFPDFLNLDVEGFELQILKSIDYERCFPKVICIETLPFGNDFKYRKKDKHLIEFLTSNAYIVYADTYINTILIHQNYFEKANDYKKIQEKSSVDFLSEIKEKKLWSEGKPIRLHLGCGEQHFSGYINVDYPPGEHEIMNVKADVFADITKLNLPGNSVDEIRLHHVFEHFSRVGALALLIRWHKWLKVCGELYIETPDFEGSAKTFLSNPKWSVKTSVIRHLAGDQVNSWAYHIDHWFPERFEKTLSRLGFGNIRTKSESWKHEPFLSNVHAVGMKARDMSIQELLLAADELLWDSTVHESEKPTYEAWKRQLRDIVLSGAELTHPVTDYEKFKFEIPQKSVEALKQKSSQLPLDEIHNFNQRDRDRWVIEKANEVPAGSSILDIGAGTCPYRANFSHCNYKAHDFKKYQGVMLGNTTEYGKIDYESDIVSIPVPDESFDYILCTEVLEHVPEPIKAMEEMTRILKPGGKMFITAPLGSGLHQLPYHYYGGYTPEWYKLMAERFNLNMIEIVSNGGYFRLLAQESARVAWTWDQHKHLHGENGPVIHSLFGEWIPRYLFSLEDNCFIDQFTIGYHVVYQKPGEKQVRNVESEKFVKSDEEDFRDTKRLLEMANEEAGKGNYEKAFRLALAVLSLEPENQEASKILSGE